MRRRLRRYRLRHKIHAIKTRPNNPLRFLQRKKSFQRYLSNDLTCAARKTTFRTRKRFHNKQYTPKSKDQPFESERTHFDTGFNNGNLQCTVRPLFFFHTKPHQSTAKSITKTTNRNNQSNQTIRKNKAPQPLNQKHPKTNTTSNYDTMQCFLNIKISQTATTSESTAK